MLWGHPFTSGAVDSVDFYVIPRGSEAESIREGSKHLSPSHSDAAKDVKGGSQRRYVEQLVRFDTLAAVFDRVSDLDGPKALPWNESFSARDETLTDLSFASHLTWLDGSHVMMISVFCSHRSRWKKYKGLCLFCLLGCLGRCRFSQWQRGTTLRRSAALRKVPPTF